MANPKDLSLSLIKKEDANKYKEKKRIYFDNGSKIDIDVAFRPTKISMVSAEVLNIIQEALDNKKQLDAGVVLGITTMLIIKHFTTIKIDGNMDYDGYMEMLKLMNDNGYTNKILESFDKDELEKVYKEVNNALSILGSELNKLLVENGEDNASVQESE